MLPFEMPSAIYFLEFASIMVLSINERLKCLTTIATMKTGEESMLQR